MADNITDKEAQKAAKEAEKAAKKAKQERIKQSKPKKEGNVVTRAGGAVKKFWKDFVGTVKKVVWPPADQVLKSSLVVLVTILLIGAVVFGIDQGLQAIYKASSNAVVELGEKNKSEEEATTDADSQGLDDALEQAAEDAQDSAAAAEETAAAAEETTAAAEEEAEAAEETTAAAEETTEAAEETAEAAEETTEAQS